MGIITLLGGLLFFFKNVLNAIEHTQKLISSLRNPKKVMEISVYTAEIQNPKNI